jgi:glycosyltransferase involved in cell wall biosynthesis
MTTNESTATFDFSLVIPAYNEEELLPRLLETVNAAKSRYVRGPDRIEIIVADNCSTDSTAAIARQLGARVAHVEKRRIGAARNGGAAIARGEILCFTDADGQIHPETFNAIRERMDTGRYVAGATGVHLDRLSPGIAVAYMFLMPLVWAMGMDTGVVFTRREDWRAVGGYNEEKRYAEDVQFLWDLKRLGWKRGQRLTRVRKVKTIASTRKWDTHGEWHYARMLLTGPFLFLFSRRTLDQFIHDYWYKRGERKG